MALFANLFKKKKVAEVVAATNPVEVRENEARKPHFNGIRASWQRALCKRSGLLHPLEDLLGILTIKRSLKWRTIIYWSESLREGEDGS